MISLVKYVSDFVFPEHIRMLIACIANLKYNLNLTQCGFVGLLQFLTDFTPLRIIVYATQIKTQPATFRPIFKWKVMQSGLHRAPWENLFNQENLIL